MKGILHKINKWLLITFFKPDTFFNKKIRWQLQSLISYILYPEFRNSFNIKNILISSKSLIITFLVSLSVLISIFTIGRLVSYNKIKLLKSEIANNRSSIDKLDSTILTKNLSIFNLSKEVRSREYIEFRVIQQSKIDFIPNLRSVPDSIFFLMVSESEKYNIPYIIFFRIMERESKFKFIPNSEGSGAMGYMQVVKSTFTMYYNKLNLKNGHTPGNNIRVAANLISSIHQFCATKFKNEITIWEYTLAEYGCGRGPMQSETGGYFIPESVKPGINYVMKYYK